MIILKNFKKRLILLLILLITILPAPVLAYSNFLIASGKTIGIEVNANGVLIVGFYEVEGKEIGKKAGFEIGDIITKINNKEVFSISNMLESLKENTTNVTFTVKRNNTEKEIKMSLKPDENNILKTGLYVKDQINGIGTLTYIDPKTKRFGALGHEILETTTAQKFEIKDGKIYNANVSNIRKSTNGNAGEKNASYNKKISEGEIDKNEISGIFGDYKEDIEQDKTLEVGTKDEVTKGQAYIRTNIKDDEIKDYEINILNIDLNSKSKNILFEVTDKTLINETGGIVQGMSGSPIIQNNKIIGAVNYVIVNDPKKGYGIFITAMLKEGEK